MLYFNGLLHEQAIKKKLKSLDPWAHCGTWDLVHSGTERRNDHNEATEVYNGLAIDIRAKTYISKARAHMFSSLHSILPFVFSCRCGSPLRSSSLYCFDLLSLSHCFFSSVMRTHGVSPASEPHLLFSSRHFIKERPPVFLVVRVIVGGRCWANVVGRNDSIYHKLLVAVVMSCRFACRRARRHVSYSIYPMRCQVYWRDIVTIVCQVEMLLMR